VNPLCGDDYHLYLRLEGGVIRDAAFQGQGCAISKASASMLTQSVKGKTVGEAETLKDRFLELATRGCTGEVKEPDKLGSLVAFQGIRRFPVRVKCATLVWHALEDALKQGGKGP
jgi:nitrogen fixation NifU-like protein